MTRTGFRFLVAAAAVLHLASAGKAAADALSGAFIGANLGRARNTYNAGLIDSQLAADASSASDTITYSEKSVRRMGGAWWFDTGYFVTGYLGIEASFLHAGEWRYLSTGSVKTSADTRSLTSIVEVISHGPALSLIGRLPLAEAFEVDVRLGDYLGKAILDDYLVVGTASAFAASPKTVSSLLAGIGASYTLAGHCSLRVDYLRVNKTGNHLTGVFSVNMVTAGLSYTF
ncbi:MAG: outer membrane beta-barrel protein [Pseudomonadota bacterium]|nr:outer membrane beta-barrel protein [Pseudomonadota bacterium]